MKAKGTAVKSIESFIKEKHSEQYNDWLHALPEASRKLFINGIKTNEWYDVNQAIINPTQKMMELFFRNDIKGAWENGRYGAEKALKGIYKIYVKATTPYHIIDRAGRAFAAYYSDSDISTQNKQKNSVDFIIEYMPIANDIIEHRIGGWCQKALEISGCKNVQVRIVESLTRKDKRTLYKLSWE